jgi:UDP-glucose:(glucosyl)LPS alpha-1,2-glucosyltransferase
MPIVYRQDYTANSKGGSEMMAERIEKRLDPDLLSKVNIIVSRVRGLDQTRPNILWLQDLPGDPESDHLKQGGWNNFAKIVFVSNWQMQGYINHYGLPWDKCVVIHNAIEMPKELSLKPTDRVNFIYHTTPHRGLEILVPTFAKLAEILKDKIHLDVYSSFSIYGWKERDEQYKALFEQISAHPNMTNHGAVENSEVRAALQKAHVFAYPSIWAETSCMALMEAMSDGVLSVHSNYGALPETAANLTWMYQYHANKQDHASVLFNMLMGAYKTVSEMGEYASFDYETSNYAASHYNVDNTVVKWQYLIEAITNKKKVY